MPEPAALRDAEQTAELPAEAGVPIFEVKDVSIYYGSFRAVTNVSLTIYEHQITAFIGPSGCGKTTVLRTLNRMNDLIPGARVEGEVSYRGEQLYGKDVSPIAVRRRIGMVFQKPNPFPKSIYDNVAYGPRINGERNKKKLDEIVERSLRQAALWDEVKNRLGTSGLSLSGGQAQRLCIARTLAVEPDVVLMDEPASALDPIATGAIEDLMKEIKDRYTIVIVTHNMQQATRVSDRTAFYSVLVNPAERHPDRHAGRVRPHRPPVRGSAGRPDQGLRHRPDGLTGRLRGGVSPGHDHDRAGRVMHHLTAYRPAEELGEPLVGWPHDEHVGAKRGGGQFCRRITRHYLHGDLGRRTSEVARGLVHDFLDPLADELQVNVVPGQVGLGPVDPGGRAGRVRVDGDDGEREAALRGLAHRPAEGMTRLAPVIQPDDDSGHCGAPTIPDPIIPLTSLAGRPDEKQGLQSRADGTQGPAGARKAR